MASQIADTLLLHDTGENRFYDLCCGAGGVFLELVNRGVSPNRITVCDAGPWGLVWSLIGEGGFSLRRFRALVNRLPREKDLVQTALEHLAACPVGRDAAYVFLVLQAGSFGGKPIWLEGVTWKNATFRGYWLPTETSSRRSPVLPMQPMPDKLVPRVTELVCALSGMTGLHGDALLVRPERGSVVYMDPPYAGTTGYGHDVNWRQFVERAGVPVYVSEGKPLSACAKKLNVSTKKGGVSGDRAESHEEWLSAFGTDVL